MGRFKKPAVPSPAMVVALTALFVALGGTGYAATQLTPARSTGAAHRAKKHPRSESTADLAQVKAFFKAHRAGLIGPAGPQGESGTRGPAGAAGPSATYSAGPSAGVLATGTIESVSVPAGRYLLAASARVANSSSTSGAYGDCQLVRDSTGATINQAEAFLAPFPNSGFAEQLAVVGTVNLDSPGKIDLDCTEGGGGTSVYADYAELTATAVGTLNGT